MAGAGKPGSIPALPAWCGRVAGVSTALRIAMVAACPFPWPRGTPIRIFRMAEALGRRGHEVHVVTYHLGGDVAGLPFQVHRIRRIRSYRKVSPGPALRKLLLLDPLLLVKLREVVRDRDVHVVHAHHYEGLLVALGAGRTPLAASSPGRKRPVGSGAGRKPDPPLVYDAHTLLGSELPAYPLGLGRGMKSWIGRTLDRRLPGRASHVIAVTERIRAWLVEAGAVGAKDVTVVPNGVEPSLLAARPRAGGGPADDPVAEPTVLFAGNLAGYQGVELLLRAFRRVIDRMPGARLLIVTDGDFGTYEPLARELGVCERLELVRAGFQELPGVLVRAQVAVNPRLACDGIPQKLMNYMATGRPIVSFAGSAAHLRHGRTAWVVEDGDVAEMAEAILRLLGDPALAERLGTAARREVAREYSWERTAEKVEAVYGRLLAAGAGSSG